LYLKVYDATVLLLLLAPRGCCACLPVRLFIVSLAVSTYDSGVHATRPNRRPSHYAADSTRPTDRTGPPSFRTPIASVEICITRYSMSRWRAVQRAAAERSGQPSKQLPKQ